MKETTNESWWFFYAFYAEIIFKTTIGVNNNLTRFFFNIPLFAGVQDSKLLLKFIKLESVLFFRVYIYDSFTSY